MANYASVWNATNTQSTTVPIVMLAAPGSSPRRVKLYEIIHSSDATPADQAWTFLIRRSSTAPSGGTSGTPAPVDSADAACSAVFMYGASIAAPTLGTSLLQASMNQRSWFRWAALDESKTLIIPATANAGLAMLPSVVTTAANYSGTWWFSE